MTPKSFWPKYTITTESRTILGNDLAAEDALRIIRDTDAPLMIVNSVGANVSVSIVEEYYLKEYGRFFAPQRLARLKAGE